MNVLYLLQRRAFRRFMDGRRGPWGAVASILFGVRMVRKWSKRNEDVVFRQKLEPGESLTITHSTLTEGSRRARRRARSAT